MKHMPGPWVNDEGTITGPGGAHIAAVSELADFPCADVEEMHPEEREEREAEYKGNAEIIAVCPEMLEVIGFLQFALHKRPFGEDYEKLIRKALDKSKELMGRGITDLKMSCTCCHGATCPLHDAPVAQ